MKLNFKVKPETVLTIAGIALGAAQMVLGAKKEANEKSMLKEEIMKELIEKLPEKKD